MADGRRQNGGARKGAGRKPLPQEIAYIEQAKRAIPPAKYAEGLKKVWERVLKTGDHKAFAAASGIFIAEVTRQESGEIGEYEHYLEKIYAVASGRKAKTRRTKARRPRKN